MRIKNRRATIQLLASISGYRQVAHSHNKHRIAHALGHEPSYCLFSCESILAVFENREQEQKLYKMYFLNQVNENGRAPC